MNPNYPLTLDLSGKKVLVVGAGLAATRRISDLLKASAKVVVVAPVATIEISKLASSGSIEWLARDFREDDLAEAWLVLAATGFEFVDSQISQLANQRQLWSLIMSDAAISTAWRPAVAFGPDGISIAVTGGGDPERAKAIRDAVSLQLSTSQLPIRAHRDSTSVGSVHLVGGGPGAVGLLTLRARYLLAIADLIVVDRLAPRGVLSELPRSIEIIDAGKSPGDHILTQDEINSLIVERAKLGARVVRLKGGDPFVLGRGSEELLACLAAGIECEIVPGVSSVTSVPAGAGIPLTHRGVAQAFTVANGHGDLPISLEDQSSTYVILMGVDGLEEIVNRFISQGWTTQTPVAVIENGWTADQRTTIGNLGNIEELKKSVGFKSPAVIVVGEVVKFHEKFGDLNNFS